MIPRYVLYLSILIPYVLAQGQPLPCRRWAHSAAFGTSPSNADTNSTLWIAGGRMREEEGQSENTWTSDLLYLDLSRDWETDNPSIQQLSTSGGPSLALGGLFSSNDGNSLYSFGGASSDSPQRDPPENQIYTYDVPNNAWSTTSSGTILRPAEGAAEMITRTATNQEPLAIFGQGHLDFLSDPSWSIHTPRMLLNSMVQIDLSDMSMSNITDGPGRRADHTLSFIPYAGTNREGVLVSIGGYDGSSLLDNGSLDVYDIGSGRWSQETTAGDIPGGRVNHCAAEGRVFVDGTWQHQIYVFGGQNLDQSSQYNDIYVLLIPSYTWHRMRSAEDDAPDGRAAHSCSFVGSQLIVIGGYVQDIDDCDDDPVSILDVERMEWLEQYDSSATTYKSPNALLPDIVGTVSGNGSPEGSSGRNTYEPADGSSGNPRPEAATTRTTTSSTASSSSRTRISVSRTSKGDVNIATEVSSRDENSRPTGDLQSASTPSTSAKVGIALAVLASAVGAGILVFFMIRRRRSKKYAQLEDKSEIDSIFDARDDGDYEDPFLPGDGPSNTTIAMNRFALDSRSLLGQEEMEEYNPVIIVPSNTSEEYVSSSEGRPSLRQRNSWNQEEQQGLSANNSLSGRTVSSFGNQVEGMDVQHGAEGGKMAKRDRLSVANP